MGFRRAKSTQGNTNCQKNIFEDDQVPGHHPRALKPRRDYTVGHVISATSQSQAKVHGKKNTSKIDTPVDRRGKISNYAVRTNTSKSTLLRTRKD